MSLQCFCVVFFFFFFKQKTAYEMRISDWIQTCALPIFPVAAVEVVVENAADAACLAAVGNEEVLVAPLLEARVEVGGVAVAGVLQGGVEVRRVLLARIHRIEIGAASEPRSEARRAGQEGVSTVGTRWSPYT